MSAFAGESSASGPSVPIGSVINGTYRIVELISCGNMGSVYRAEQRTLGRSVALKVLEFRHRSEDPKKVLKRRFFLEASLAAKLSHPNIVTIHDFGKVQGLDHDAYFIAMEFMGGGTLADRLRERGGALAPAEAIQIVSAIARGLNAAHREGLVHRDLKPTNVMLTPNDDEGERVTIVDFGLVKQFGELPTEDVLTEAGEFVGSPRYISPEQARGIAVDHRSDLYALGVILYQCLCGQVPFDEGPPLRTLLAHVTKPVPRMCERSPGCAVPPALEMLARRLLAKEPAVRIGSAAELLGELRLLQDALGFGASASLPGTHPSGRVQPGIEVLTTEYPSTPGEPLRVLAASADASTPSALTRTEPPGPRSVARLRSRTPVLVTAALFVLLGAVAWVGSRRSGAVELKTNSAPSGGVPAAPAASLAGVQPSVATEERPAARSSALEPSRAASARPSARSRRDPAGPTATRPTGQMRPVRAAPAGALPSTAPGSKAGGPQNAAAAGSFGFLSLDTTPWSIVSTGGRELGMTPFATVRLPAGTHVLLLRNPNLGVSMNYVVTIRSGETTARRLRLE